MTPAARRLASSLPAVLTLGLFLLLPFLGSRDLWAPDEPRYAEVSSEILRDGHWWYPHVNGHPYPDKPPLYFWLGAIASMPAGRVSELTARLPSALAGLALLALTWSIGRRVAGERAGAIAGVVLATTWLFAWMARRVALDVMLSAWVTAAIWAALRAGAAARAGSSAARSAAWGALAGVFTGLAVMTKGPVAFLFLLPPAVVALAHRGARDVLGPRRLRAFSLGAAVALAAVLLAWLVPAHLLGGYDPVAVFREHVVDRAAEGRHHIAPPWYFLTSVPLDFQPWFLAGVMALVAAWRARRDATAAWILAWAAVPLILLSIIVEKRNIYVLPLLPAWALLVGRWAGDRDEARPGLRVSALLGLFMVGVMAAASVACLGGLPPALMARVPEVGDLRWSIAAMAAAAAAGTALLFVALRKRAGSLELSWALGLAFALPMLALFAMLPRFDVVKSARPLARELSVEAGASSPVGMHPRTLDAYAFYSGRTFADLPDAASIRGFLAGEARPAFVLLQDDTARDLPPGGFLAASARVGHRQMQLWRWDAPAHGGSAAP